MKLEDRYIVLKRKDVEKHLNDDEKITFYMLCEEVDNGRRDTGNGSIEALVIEKGWPEYATALEALSERVDS